MSELRLIVSNCHGKKPTAERMGYPVGADEGVCRPQNLERSRLMICDKCKNAELINGTLEGVSFQPSSEEKKLFSKGIYGIRVLVCPGCGSITDMRLDVKVLKKMIK